MVFAEIAEFKMKNPRLMNLLSSAAAIGGASAAFMAFVPVANAASLTFDANQFTGDAARVRITLDDMAAGAGKIQFKVDFVSDPSTSMLGDLRGIFFNIADNSLLSGLRIEGPQVTTYVTGNGNISSVGNANLNGGGNAHAFDVGVEIGQNGLKGGKDDFQTTTFTLFHTSQSLDLSLFAQQEFGIRVTSVGTGNRREGSSKLVATSPNLPPITVQPPSNPTLTPAPAPEVPVVANPTPTPAPEVPVASEPEPVTINPPATPGPVPDSSTTPKPTEVPEPGAVSALAIASVGAFKFLKRRGQA
jgi:hypothetical protein